MFSQVLVQSTSCRSLLGNLFSYVLFIHTCFAVSYDVRTTPQIYTRKAVVFEELLKSWNCWLNCPYCQRARGQPLCSDSGSHWSGSCVGEAAGHHTFVKWTSDDAVVARTKPLKDTSQKQDCKYLPCPHFCVIRLQPRYGMCLWLSVWYSLTVSSEFCQ